MKQIVIVFLGALSMSLNAQAFELQDRDVKIGGIDVEIKALPSGQSAYYFDLDSGAQGGTACRTTCAEKWPPVLITPDEEKSLTKDYGVLDRGNGLKQMTYNGHPLYTFYQDRVAGEVKGEGLGGVWHVVRNYY
jgi:predicted lipoprotein with Yx(FWY)xxD motif